MNDSTAKFIEYTKGLGLNVVIVGRNVSPDVLQELIGSHLTVIQQGVREESVRLLRSNTGKGPRGRWGQIQ